MIASSRSQKPQHEYLPTKRVPLFTSPQVATKISSARDTGNDGKQGKIRTLKAGQPTYIDRPPAHDIYSRPEPFHDRT